MFDWLRRTFIYSRSCFHTFSRSINIYISFSRTGILQYKATDITVEKGTKFQLCEIIDGNDKRYDVFTFSKSGGVIMGMYNTDEVSFKNLR